ncbi:MAG TPA: nuclear transport factor 2 family protein [Propionibacteriaceae bacterium]|nr:nuclear transport factor 2 family protein [Propionibacteriaceae bacterium]
MLVLLAPASSAGAQQLSPRQREVWESVEARWHAWQGRNLEQLLLLHHARFHRWNPRTGTLQSRDSLPPQWRMMTRFETVDSVALEPVAIDLFGDAAAVHYISRETVRLTAEAPPVVAGRAKAGVPQVVSIRWSDYLVKTKGRWLYIGGARINCSPLEGSSSCRDAK